MEMGLTQEKFAERMGVDTRTVQKWEGPDNLSLWTLYRLTVVSGRPASDFFTEPTIPKPGPGRPKPLQHLSTTLGGVRGKQFNK
jgi:transcriptional regulator with XRE-family HTH domain